MSKELQGYMTLSEAAEKIGLSKSGIRFWVLSGRLETTRISGFSFVSKEDLVAAMNDKKKAKVGRSRKCLKL